MTDRKKFNVKIDGRTFTVVGEGSKAHIESIASHVDDIIREVSSKNDRLSQIMTATLAALHIADELHKKQVELEELKHKAKDPLDKYDDVCKDLKESKEKIETLNNMIEEYKRQITDYEKKREQMESIIEKLEAEIKDQNEKIIEKDETIKTLQDKNFTSQLEIVDIKKELSEYLKLLDEKTSY